MSDGYDMAKTLSTWASQLNEAAADWEKLHGLCGMSTKWRNEAEILECAAGMLLDALYEVSVSKEVYESGCELFNEQDQRIEKLEIALLDGGPKGGA